jgi:hypothetical protein
MKLKGVVFLSAIEKRHWRGTYDYYDAAVREISSGEVPGSFGGVSGGGLWHIHLRPSQSTGKFSWDRSLIGLAFYQSPVRRDCRFIRCHGRRSLYVKALGSLALPTA